MLSMQFCRFTEELFATLIAFIFIFNAFKNIFKISEKNKFTPSSNDLSCECVGNNTERLEYYNVSSFDNVTRDKCKEYGGYLVGEECDFHPNVLLMSILLFAGAFTISFALKNFRNTGKEGAGFILELPC